MKCAAVESGLLAMVGGLLLLGCGGGTRSGPNAPPLLVASPTWVLYDALRLPDTAGFVESSGSLGGSASRFTQANGDGTIFFDSGDPAAKGGWLIQPLTADAPRTFTFLVRLKAEDPASRGLDFDFRFGGQGRTPGPRTKFIVKPNEIVIEKPDGASSASSERYAVNGMQFRTFHLGFDIAPTEIATTVYLDGNDQPVMSVKGTALVPQNRLSFGDMGSSSCRSTIDWMIWTAAANFKSSDLENQLPTSLGDVSAYQR